MQQLNIRKAIPDNAASISKLINNVAHCFNSNASYEIAPWFIASVTPPAIKSYIADESYNYLAGFMAQTLAGVIAIRGSTHVHHLFVAPEFRRQGIASKLWAHAKADAISAGNTEGFSVRSSIFAVPFYENFGFKVTGTTSEKDGIVFVPMKLELSINNSDTTNIIESINSN